MTNETFYFMGTEFEKMSVSDIIAGIMKDNPEYDHTELVTLIPNKKEINVNKKMELITLVPNKKGVFVNEKEETPDLHRIRSGKFKHMYHDESGHLKFYGSDLSWAQRILKKGINIFRRNNNVKITS
jgi:hypothetical protein